MFSGFVHRTLLAIHSLHRAHNSLIAMQTVGICCMGTGESLDLLFKNKYRELHVVVCSFRAQTRHLARI